MARMRRTSELPVKTCLHCQREFAWRRKWARDWPQVRFCSQRCKGEYKRAGRSS